MAPQHIVVDGSNIATEGRSMPSLKQLEEAVAELRREHPGAEVTVIVDATFAHRIDASELDRFEAGALAGDYVHPPAGAIGRGDAFLLRVAEKVDATVLSNDSFQEFHGEHPWLFERGRLLGVTPVPGIGWIFSPRTPVRGPTSRQAVREADRARRDVTKAIKVATMEAVAPPGASGPKPKIGDRRVMRQTAAVSAPQRQPLSPAAVNDPLTFVSFIAEHPLGAEVTGRVDSYTSHGAVVMVGNAQCYVPLANLGSPPPRSAREMLSRGADVTFVVRALDPQRRGVELALPGVGTVSGTPSEEMIEAEVRLARKRQPAANKVAGGSRRAAKAIAGTDDQVTATGISADDTGSTAQAAEASASAVAKAAGGQRRRTRSATATPVSASVEESSGPTVEEPKQPGGGRRRSRTGPAAEDLATATAAPPSAPIPAKAARPSKTAAAAKVARPSRSAGSGGSPGAPSDSVGAAKTEVAPTRRARKASATDEPVVAPRKRAASAPPAVLAPALALVPKAPRAGGSRSSSPQGDAAKTAARKAPERKAVSRTVSAEKAGAQSPSPEKAARPRKSPRATKKAAPRT
jgi:hypothetical protein